MQAVSQLLIDNPIKASTDQPKNIIHPIKRSLSKKVTV